MFVKYSCKIMISLMLLAGMVSTASAVVSPIRAALPNVIDPGQAQKNLQEQQANTLQETVPKGAIQNQLPRANEVIPEGEKIKFRLDRVIITGNTVFSMQELQAVFTTYLHKTISLVDLQNLVQDITAKYRAAGYILSRAILPAQEIKNGLVKIQIVEGHISQVIVTGDERTRGLLEKYGQHILQSKPLKIAVLEHEMLLVNDLPGMNVRAVLTPSKTVPAAADLTLIAERKLINASLSYDDYGTRFLGPLETSAGVTANSVFFPGDSTAMHYTITSQNNELQYYDLVHTQPIGTNGTNFTVGANTTRTEAGFLLQGFEVMGRSNSIYSNLTYPFIRSRAENLQAQAALNYQNVFSTILGTPFYQDRVRSLTLGGYYDLTDHWNGYSTLGLNLGRGFDIFGADKHFNQSRPRGLPNYTKTTFSASRLQPIYGRISLYGSTQGQYAFNSLLASEQFGFGGPVYGRGYGPSEIVGDRGLEGKVELRYDSVPEFKYLQVVEYYVFYDMGAIWNIDTLNLPAKQSGASTGIGIRFNFMPQLYGETYIAKPLTRQAFTLTPPDQNGNQARAFFQIVARI